MTISLKGGVNKDTVRFHYLPAIRLRVGKIAIPFIYIAFTTSASTPVSSHPLSNFPNTPIMPVPVRLRLARHGHRHNPIFHLVAINSQKPRNAQPIETLGEYDPVPRVASTSALPQSSQVFGEKKTAPVPKEKKVEWDVARINYWLGVGAQPTKSVVRLLERVSSLALGLSWAGS
jgi:small subunit ribosomal protein S16